MNNKEEVLCKYVEYNDLENIHKLLDEGANPTDVSFFGRTAIGIACVNKHADALELLLSACKNFQSFQDDGGSEAKKWKSHSERPDDDSETPEGMDDLQWEDEMMRPQSEVINEDQATDEWSVLYRYYASIIEKTGEMLANTISFREPHCLDAFQQAPIHYAATVGSFKCIELLLEYNAPINMTTNIGYTALHLAVEQPKIVELLLRHKANPNKLTFYDSLAPIHLAAKIGIVETIQLLKDFGAMVNITNASEQTPLYLAVAFQKYDAAVKLIQCDAKVNVQDEKGLTPLYTAIVLNDCRMVKMLLKNGARLLPSQYLLSFTIRNRMSEMTHLLVEAGENVNGRDPIGWTPLLLAINKRDVETIEYLISNGALLNENDYVLKELHIAVQQSNSIDIFDKLFTSLRRHGVEIDSLNKWGETPVCLAMLMEKYKIAEYLIKEGSDLNTGSLIKAKDCMLLVRECNNLNLIKLFVNAGTKMLRPELLNLVHFRKSAELHRQNLNSSKSCERYLMNVLTNPLTLKQLARIVIRDRIIVNMKHFQFVKDFAFASEFYRTNPIEKSNQRNLFSLKYTNSIFECLIWQLIDLPKILHYYLYAFPDVD